MPGARSLLSRAAGPAAIALLALAFVSGCGDETVVLNITANGAGPHQVFIPEEAARVEIVGNWSIQQTGVIDLVVESDSTWVLSMPGASDGSLEWEDRTTVRNYVPLACTGFEDDGIPETVCTVGEPSEPLGFVTFDIPVKIFPTLRYFDAGLGRDVVVRTDIPTLVFERVDEAPSVVLRGGRWGALTGVLCDDVDAAGSLDDWIAADPAPDDRDDQVVAACNTVFGAPTGDYRCFGQDVEVQCN